MNDEDTGEIQASLDRIGLGVAMIVFVLVLILAAVLTR